MYDVVLFSASDALAMQTKFAKVYKMYTTNEVIDFAGLSARWDKARDERRWVDIVYPHMFANTRANKVPWGRRVLPTSSGIHPTTGNILLVGHCSFAHDMRSFNVSEIRGFAETGIIQPPLKIDPDHVVVYPGRNGIFMSAPQIALRASLPKWKAEGWIVLNEEVSDVLSHATA